MQVTCFKRIMKLNREKRYIINVITFVNNTVYISEIKTEMKMSSS